jgi:serine/threonine-protein phosphatase 2A activator
MAVSIAGPRSLPPTVTTIDDVSLHVFLTPTKRINDGEDLNFFLASEAHRDIIAWILTLNRASFPKLTDTGEIQRLRLDDGSVVLSDGTQKVKGILSKLDGMISHAPPSTGPRRFGNVAFRTWYSLMEESADELLQSLFSPDDILRRNGLCDELKPYLLGAFGSAPRLDYGTGHELSFLALLCCLWKIGTLRSGEEQAIVVGIIQPYLALVRRLILTYTLEPAGSHGVWGLDDHSFIPYILGSAQFGPAIDLKVPVGATPIEGSLRGSPSPSNVTNAATVKDLQDSNLYFAAVQFIYDVKKGPFWEHSPVLYDISGIKDGWAKINKGMLKMYAAEVLGKFPVVQHFPFGSLLSWERCSGLEPQPASFHGQQLPTQAPGKNASAAASTGTKAPWSSGRSPMQVEGGTPTTRTPPSVINRHLDAQTSGNRPGSSLNHLEGQPGERSARG